MRLFTGFDNALALDVGDRTVERCRRIDVECRLITRDKNSEQGVISQICLWVVVCHIGAGGFPWMERKRFQAANNVDF